MDFSECVACPYISDELNEKMRHYEKTIRKCGIPNDIYGDLTPSEAVAFFLGTCICMKTGEVAGTCGLCFSSAKNMKKQQSSAHPSRNKRERDEKHKKHLIRLEKIGRKYPFPVWYNEYIYKFKKGCSIKNPKPYYKRCYRDHHPGGGRYKYHKRAANRKVRRCRFVLSARNRGQYHKVYDYWWNVD